MPLPAITYFITYANDYPGLSGDEHAFFINASTSDSGLGYLNEYIESHPAAGCFIDHESRLNDYEITDEMKLKVRRNIWSAIKAVESDLV